MGHGINLSNYYNLIQQEQATSLAVIITLRSRCIISRPTVWLVTLSIARCSRNNIAVAIIAATLSSS